MGRHSAPEEEPDPSDAPTVVLEAVPATRPARHLSAADDEEAETAEAAARPGAEETAVADDRTGETAAAEVERGDRPTPAPRPEGATHADLRLLRENPALRARCAAAVVIPFVLYTVVMIVLGGTAAYLVWVWVPTVLAGVTVGTFLDVAHRRENQR
jgi:hypothetical protein